MTVEYNNSQLNLHHHFLPYDDNGLLEIYDEKQIPARDFIRKAFIVRHP